MKSLLFLFFFSALAANVRLSPIESRGSEKKLVCYFSSWDVYRPGNGKFDVENIDPFLCTHVIYAFTGLGPDYKIKSLDPWNDLYDNYGKGAFLRFTNLKTVNPNLKTLVAIGGWNEGSERYSMMVADPAKRAIFLQSVIEFIQQYNFDGLDFDWEYPGSRGGVPADKQNYISMLRELKNAFAPRGWLLSAAVSAGKSTIDAAYDIPAMNSIIDFVNLMAYDYHGAWETYTGLVSPLYENPQYDIGDNRFLNTNWSTTYWISKGFSPSKIVLGLPLYGRGWSLANSNQNTYYAPAYQPIPAGPYTREAGYWGYNEICEKFIYEAWTIGRDTCYYSPYAVKGNLWIGYDDAFSFHSKGQYIAAMGLGGGMVWSIETDDFKPVCQGYRFPLIKTLKNAINGPVDQMPVNPCNGGSSSPAITPTVSMSSTTQSTSTTTTTRPIITTTTTTGPIITTTTTTRPIITTTTTSRPINTTTASTSTTTTTVPSTTTASPHTTTTSTTTSSSDAAYCKKEGLNADPNDCGYYYQCVRYNSGWQVWHMPCAPATVFSEPLETCAHPWQVPGCENYYNP